MGWALCQFATVRVHHGRPLRVRWVCGIHRVRVPHVPRYLTTGVLARYSSRSSLPEVGALDETAMKVPSSPRFCVPGTPRTSGLVVGPAPGSNGSQIICNSPQVFLCGVRSKHTRVSLVRSKKLEKQSKNRILGRSQPRSLRKNTGHNARGTIRTLGGMR